MHLYGRANNFAAQRIYIHYHFSVVRFLKGIFFLCALGLPRRAPFNSEGQRSVFNQGRSGRSYWGVSAVNYY